MAQKYYQARNSTLNGSSWILKKYKLLWITAALFFTLGCGLFAPTAAPDSDLFATLQASTPSGFSSPVVTQPGTTPVFNSFTPVATPTNDPSVPDSAATSVPSPSSSDQPTGHIVFTCQIFKVQAMNQVCIMNADGTGFRRLTTEDNIQHVYPSLSPDGQSVLYAAFREQNVYEIYKLDLEDGSVDRLTNKIGVLTSPEFSPDGERITFTRGKTAITTVISHRSTAGTPPGHRMGNGSCSLRIAMGRLSYTQ
jgi:hypothetical protein